MGNFTTRNSKAAKLSVSQVMDIKRRYQDGESQGALSRVFAVSVGQIGRIVRGESWQATPAAPRKEEMAAAAKRSLEFYQSLNPMERMVQAIEAKKEEDGKGDKMLEELDGTSAQEEEEEAMARAARESKERFMRAQPDLVLSLDTPDTAGHLGEEGLKELGVEDSILEKAKRLGF